MNNNLNKNFSEIRNGFSALEGQDKLVYLIDFLQPKLLIGFKSKDLL